MNKMQETTNNHHHHLRLEYRMYPTSCTNKNVESLTYISYITSYCHIIIVFVVMKSKCAAEKRRGIPNQCKK